MMLNILVCVKQVPDVDQMKMDPETGSLVRAGVPAILNPGCERTGGSGERKRTVGRRNNTYNYGSSERRSGTARMPGCRS